MALSRARRDRGVDYWPGFVDALSTLILGIIFLLTVFVVVQFVLSQEVTGKDTALARLAARISQLTDLLGLEQTNKVSLEEQIAQLRANLANRPDIRIVGDRFVLQSEVFFDVGQSVLKPEGRTELDKIAAVLLDVTQKIPQDIAWVLRVDGHTDLRPVGGNRTNWDLSAARAIAVVQYLISKGMPPQRLVAAGFGEFQPIDPGTSEEAYSRNRRIELKLTER